MPTTVTVVCVHKRACNIVTNRFCIVIPHFRHHHPLARLLPQLVRYELPIYVVDDASGDACKVQLAATVAQFHNVSLIERSVNGGKGAAMMTGLQYAAANDFTHVISLDADGQHNPGDVGRLRDCSAAAPDSLFSGRPVFGPDIPKSRLYGRKLTNGLVRFVTGSDAIIDAMCGLRVYPLKTVLPLCEQTSYRTRMEFDVEILVRASWQGLTIGSLDTQVVYPEDGESHFNLVADNARLVAMHTILILGGLRRSASRLLKRVAMPSVS